MNSYYDWTHDTQNCPNCDWKGTGSEARLGESFDSGAEYHCPKCDHYFRYVAYPLIEEALNDPRAPDGDRLLAEIAKQKSMIKSSFIDARVIVRSHAMRYQLKLWMLFFATLVVGAFIWWLGDWAASKSGWEGNVISFLFKGAGSISLMLSFFFGVMLWSWFTMYKGALGSADWYARDPSAFSRAYREVLGPIPWGGES